MKLNSLLTGLALCAATTLVFGHDFKLGSIGVAHPYARASVPGQVNGSAYLKIDNAGSADRLVSARAAVASSVELHSMTMEGDVMRMRQLDVINLPAGAKIELKPGGLHIMLMGLKAPLAAGGKFPLTLKFEKAGELTVTVDVEAAGAAPAAHVH